MRRRGPDVAIASVVAVLRVRGAYCAYLQARDTRIYRFTEGGVYRLTHDHNLVQELVYAAASSEEAAESHSWANVITRAVGASEEDGFALHQFTGTLQPGDRFLLCSDGLTKPVPEQEIAGLLGITGAEAAQRVIEAALDRPARDNVTMVVLDILGQTAERRSAWIRAERCYVSVVLRFVRNQSANCCSLSAPAATASMIRTASSLSKQSR